MAKYDITYACGHEGTINVCGPTKDRDRKVAYVQEQDCPACANAAKPVNPATCTAIPVRTDGTVTAVTFAVTGNTYPIKDDLKAAGYRFVREMVVDGYVQAAWVQTFQMTTADDKAMAQTEIYRLKAAGIKTTQAK